MIEPIRNAQSLRLKQPNGVILFSLLFALFALHFILIPAALAGPSKSENFEFTTSRDEVTFINYTENTFAVFPASESWTVPSRMGRVERDERGIRLIPTQQIQRLENLYVLTKPEDPEFLSVNERTPEGGFGRLMRYRGIMGEGNRVDLEFVYDDRSEEITILDYQSGRFYRTTFTAPRRDPFSIAPKGDDARSEVTALATPNSSSKYLYPESGTWIFPVSSQRIDRLTKRLSSERIWASRLVRGPPTDGALS